MGRLTATVSGDGPAVLLLHGQPGLAEDWAAVVTALGPDRRAIVPDRPGYGATGGRALGLRENAEAACALLDDLAVPRALVVGHSWATAAALALADAAPDRVAGLVLVSPLNPADRLGPLDRLLAHPAAGAVLARTAFLGLGWALAPVLVRDALADRVSGLDAAGLAVTATAWRNGAVWRSFHAEQRALTAELPALATAPSSLRMPVTVLVGARDRLTPAGSARRLAAAIPGARLEIVEGAGHLLPFSHPEIVATAARELGR